MPQLKTKRKFQQVKVTWQNPKNPLFISNFSINQSQKQSSKIYQLKQLSKKEKQNSINKGKRTKYLSQLVAETSNQKQKGEDLQKNENNDKYQMLMNQFLSSYKQQDNYQSKTQQKTLKFGNDKGLMAKLSGQNKTIVSIGQNTSSLLQENSGKKDQKNQQKIFQFSNIINSGQNKINKSSLSKQSQQSLHRISQSPKAKIQRANLQQLLQSKHKIQKKDNLSYFKKAQKHLNEFPQRQKHVQDFNFQLFKSSNAQNNRNNYFKMKQKQSISKENQTEQKMKNYANKNQSLSNEKHPHHIQKKNSKIKNKSNNKKQIVIDIQLEVIQFFDKQQNANQTLKQHQKRKQFKQKNNKKSNQVSKSNNNKQNKLQKSFFKRNSQQKRPNKVIKGQIYKIYMPKFQTKNYKLQTEPLSFSNANRNHQKSEKSNYECTYSIEENEKYLKPFDESPSSNYLNQKSIQFKTNPTSVLNQEVNLIRPHQIRFIKQIKNDMERLINKINLIPYHQNA